MDFLSFYYAFLSLVELWIVCACFIEKFHLPPDLSATSSRDQTAPALKTSTNHHKNIDF